MKKRIISLMLASIMLLAVLTGCAQKNVNSASESTNASTSSTTSTAAITGTLEVAVFSNGDLMDDFWNKAVEEFNSLYPDCKVTLIANPKIEDSIRPRFVSGNPPDVYSMGGNANADEAALTAEGKFLKLNDFYNTAKSIGYDGLLKDNMAAEVFNKVGEDIYGMASAYGVWGYYYNVTMAKENGWTAPTNWAEFCELAPKIKAKGIYPLIHQGKYPDYLGYGLMQPGIATDYGRDTLVKMGNLDAATYRSENVLKAFSKFELLRQNDWTPAYALSLTHTEAQMEWLQGKAFILPCGNWLEPEMAKDIPEGFEMAFMPTFWHDSNTAPVYVASGTRVSIAAASKNPEAAKAFLAVLYSKNMTQWVVKDLGSIPCVKDSLDGIEMTPSTANILQQVSEGKVQVINEIGGAGNFEPYAEQRDATKNAIAAILGGQKTAKQAVADLATEVERIAADNSIAKIKIS